MSFESRQEGKRTRLLAILTGVLLLVLLLLLGPVRTTVRHYGVGPLQALQVAAVNLLKGPVRVGIQIGHLDVHLHADELEELRFNTGGHAAGVDELEVNRLVAAELTAMLERAGIVVELLPASVPIHYTADAVVSLHADSVLDPARNGYKSAHFEPARNQLEPLLKEAMDGAWLPASGLADDSLNTSSSMFRYYGFNPEFRHSVNPATPALLVEMGYISNSTDRQFLLQPELPARLIADGIIAFLTEVRRLPVTPH